MGFPVLAVAARSIPLLSRKVVQVSKSVVARVKISTHPKPGGKPCGELSYDSANRITRAEDVLGRSVVYTYNADGRLETVKDPENGVARYSYENGLLKTITDPKQTVYLTNEYDTNGRVKKQTQPDTGTYSFSYTLDGAGKVTATQLTDPRNHVRRVEFDAAGFPVTDTLAYGTALAQKTTIAYDPTTHLPTSYLDALNRRTDLGYDAYGNVHTVTELAGTAAVRTTTIDHEGPYQQISKVTDPLSHATSFGYGPNNALRTATDAMTRVTTLETGEDGQVKSATTADDPATTYGYALGDLATTTDPLGNVTRTFTDAAGRTVRGTDAQGNTTTLSYTGTSQVHTVTDPLGRVTTFEYDANGNLHRSIDARQHATVYDYDTSDRLHTVTDSLGRVATYTYDANGNVAALLSAAGKRTNFTYDELDRLDLVRYGVSADGSTQESQVRYGYDLGDRIRTVTDSAAGLTTVTPDDFDRITSAAGPQGTVGYTYDAGDRRRTMTVAGQADTTYTYNNADQLTTVGRGSLTVTVDYDTAGRRKTLTLPAGVTQSYSYDDASQLKTIGYSRGTTSLGAINYTLDPLGRLIHSEGSYARVQLPAAYGPATYDDANQLTTAGGATFGYDDDGNLASDGTATYAWNGRGQLTSYAKPGMTVTYGYDGLGRRASRTAGGTTTGYLYDGLNAVQETNGTAVTASMLTGGLDEVFSRTTSAGSQSLLSDALGSTVALASASAIGAEYTYDPFGTTSVTGDDGGNPTRFTGREDDGNGLYYDRARYLSPGTGRFISQDPAGLASGDTNPYTYAANEPTGLIDPLGLKPQGSQQSCASNSFASGTPVLMADGTTKPIEQVHVGDRVMAGSGGDAAAPRQVTATITGDGDKDLVEVTVAGGETLTATAGHPFWTDDDGAATTPGGRWIDAAELRQGDWLRTSDGRLVRVAGTHALRQHAVVHNLTIDDLHTYYVAAGGDAVLVHNTGGSECGARSLLDRAKELKTRNATTAVVRVRATKPSADGSFAEETWIATSYKSQPTKWKQAGFLKPGEVYKSPANPQGPATHAEEDIVAALGNDWQIVEGAANVNVCAGRCMPALHQLGIKVGGEVFLTYKADVYTPWRLFWSH